MIKTIADAYEALKGDIKGVVLPHSSDKYLFFNVCDSRYETRNEKLGHPARFKYICTVEEFNNFKKDSKMNKFDLEKALAGDKVVTRDGREVTQLVKFNGVDDGAECIYALVDQFVMSFFSDGRHCPASGEYNEDLFMVPKQLSGFVNVYKSGISCLCISREQADADATQRNNERIACIDLSTITEGHGL